ncbi:MAG: HAMP domain-containing histidine kinase [Clostridia bacterium]|nr:HAMP domain-containing histidine kinase [Clostridia bacterium]
MKNSIVKRWAVTILGVSVFLALAVCIFICFFIKTQHYNMVEATLRSRANTLVMSYFNTQSFVYDDFFNSMANEFVDEFPDKEIMEAWVINKNGSVVASTTGFSVKDEIYPDYDFALESKDGIGIWIGKLNSNEKIMALTYILPNNNNVSGAIRYIISLDDIDSQLLKIYIVACFVTFLICFFIGASGGFFVHSIIQPVRRINETAKQMAKGDFGVAVEKYRFDDEIGQLCDTINNMAYEIGESDRVKSEFISTVSHELRTPLTAIKGWGETIKSSPDDNELVEKGLDVIMAESDRLSGLVEELLDFSRIERGKMSLNLSQTDIVNELNGIIESFQSRAKNENIELISEIETQSLMINADVNRLKQVFFNVFDNAFKYNKPNGYVKVSLTENTNSVTVSIADNGCGISRLDLPRVKEKFYKANNSVRGSGIGLAVADEIIKMHNGNLKIESVVSVGTTVSITLPKNQ